MCAPVFCFGVDGIGEDVKFWSVASDEGIANTIV